MTRWHTSRVLGPAAVLFAIMTAHTILETARDALFLAKLGPQHLAWAYLAIAATAFVAVVAFRRWGRLRDPRLLLVAFLVVAVVGTSVLAATIAIAPAMAFVLYVWTGLVATLVVPTFWTMIDRNLRIADAKRLFAAIGAGGTLGAMTGSAIAGSLGRVISAHHLVTVGAIAFTAAAVMAFAMTPSTTDAPATPAAPDARAKPRRYVRWLFAVVLVSTITLTIGDLTFKRVIAERLDPSDLASVFGAIYTGLNVLSLIIQLALTPVLLARLGVGGALFVLPVIVVATSLGFVASGALIAIIALKVGDGGLRHSLHRVATEILYIPMPTEARNGAKPIADAFGQRGGQAAAAVLVIALAAAGAGSTSFALVTVAIGVVWLVVVALVRARYVKQFRDTLRAGEIHRNVRVPDLDATSIELLNASLSSPDELEALAALELLAGPGGRIPPLVLYHPRASVVHRALQLLGDEPRPEVERVLSHLFELGDPRVRAAALAAAVRTRCHQQHLVDALDDQHADVRAVALVAALRHPELEVDRRISEMLAGTPADRLALARALGLLADARSKPLIGELLAYREPPVTRELLRLLARVPELVELDRMLTLLADPHVRSEVRRVLIAVGEPALERLIAALDDPRTPVTVRRHIPRTLSRFGTRIAAAALAARLPREPDGITEFKILRALGRMRTTDPRLPIDTNVVRKYARRAVADAARYATLADRLATERERSPGLELLAELLAEKRRFAIEHVFRALHILQPRAGLRSVHDAMTSNDVDRRATAREIIEHLVRSEIRGPLLAVLDDLPPETRRARLGELAPGPFPTHESFVAALLSDPSVSLRCVVAHHVGERRLFALRPDLARLTALDGPPLVVQAFQQAIARLDG